MSGPLDIDGSGPTRMEQALGLATLGFDVFPVRITPDLQKRPLTANGFKDATDDRVQIEAWWRRWPTAAIGLALPLNTAVADLDTYKAEYDPHHGLELPETVRQTTGRGGQQLFYRTDGRPVRQLTNVRPGIDTRVGGKGYVVVYQPEAIAPPEAWAGAPAWFYGAHTASSEDFTFAVHDPAYVAADAGVARWGDNAMASEAGRLAGMGLGIGAIADALDAKHAVHQNGQPYDYVKDCLRIAKSVHDKEHRDHTERYLTLPAAPAPDGMDAMDLLALELPPLRQAFVGLIPEGLGVLASPPKAGKSLLCYQAAVELIFGGMLLGRQGERRPVLYFALEDGRLRSQTRIRNVVGSRHLPRGLDLRWTAPRLGGPLEAEIDGWLAAHPVGVVFIDVLSKVRPTGKAGLNAYDEDYNALNGIHGVAKAHPGSTIVLVTHDRKAGSDDWMTKVTGTRGVTGVADFAIFIDRKRGSDTGWIHVTGRDLPDDSIDVTFSGDGWRLTDVVQLIGAKSPTRQAIYGWLKEHGPGYPKAIAEGTGLDLDVVRHRVQDMVDAGDLRPVPTGYVVTSEEPDAGMTGHDG